ncbi:MAG: hypothetical protein MUO40_12400, partial [Anaerolineaceae bacterium]|nr:hypothetical protein [Anaerolineaceae bacterium]
KNGFFNIEPGQETLNIKSQVDITAGSLEYRLSDPGGMAVYAGTLNAGDTLDETFPLVAIKGNYIFYIYIEEAVGDYHFIITVD